MSLTKFVKWPKYEEYKEMFKEHFIMEKRDDGVLLVRMHTNGGPQLWSMELHRAIGQMWRTVGSDSEIELVIFHRYRQGLDHRVRARKLGAGNDGTGVHQVRTHVHRWAPDAHCHDPRR